MSRKHSVRVNKRGDVVKPGRIVDQLVTYGAIGGVEVATHLDHRAWLAEITKNVNRRLGNR